MYFANTPWNNQEFEKTFDKWIIIEHQINNLKVAKFYIIKNLYLLYHRSNFWLNFHFLE